VSGSIKASAYQNLIRKEEGPWQRKNVIFISAFIVFMWVFAPLVSTAQSPPASVGAGSGPMKGICVYYNDKFQGHVVASGEKYDKEALTAVHKTLPFGTMVKVTNLKRDTGGDLIYLQKFVRSSGKGPHLPVGSLLLPTSRQGNLTCTIAQGLR
jgi:hypothetical protein